MNTLVSPIQTLVVDDSEDECALLALQLRFVDSVKLIGFVHDGIEAIHYLRGIAPFKDREMFPYPDLLLLDYSMPRCGGMEVLKFLQPKLYRPRIVLWSNTLERVNVRLALHLGADMVCRKPADKAELMKIIHRIETRIFDAGSFLQTSGKLQPVSANK
jgi:CheY-like chemotaxis protein